MKKIWKQIGILSLVFMLLITFAPISVDAAKKSITLNQTKATLYAGEYTTVSVKKVTGLKSKKVSYSTSNKNVATVNKNGVVTAKKKGSVTITVTSKENKKVKAKFKLTIKKKPSKSSITLKKTSDTIKVGESTTIKVKSTKGLSSKKVKYSTSNKSIATVSSNGKVTGKKAGNATITVTSAVNKKVVAKFKVTVKEDETIPYAERHGLKFSDTSSFKVPTYACEVDEYENVVENSQIEFKQNKVKVIFDKISQSEPDEDGNVVLTVEYHYEGKVECDELQEFYGHLWVPNFSYYDYYTGQKFPGRDTSGSDEYEAKKKIQWNGKTYSVKYRNESEWKYGESDYYDNGSGWYWRRIPAEIYYKTEITMPAEYDGFMFIMSKKGTTKESAMNSDYVLDDGKSYLLDDFKNKDNLICIRISDYAK